MRSILLVVYFILALVGTASAADSAPRYLVTLTVTQDQTKCPNLDTSIGVTKNSGAQYVTGKDFTRVSFANEADWGLFNNPSKGWINVNVKCKDQRGNILSEGVTTFEWPFPQNIHVTFSKEGGLFKTTKLKPLKPGPLPNVTFQ